MSNDVSFLDRLEARLIEKIALFKGAIIENETLRALRDSMIDVIATEIIFQGKTLEKKSSVFLADVYMKGLTFNGSVPISEFMFFNSFEPRDLSTDDLETLRDLLSESSLVDPIEEELVKRTMS